MPNYSEKSKIQFQIKNLISVPCKSGYKYSQSLLYTNTITSGDDSICMLIKFSIQEMNE